MHFGSTSTVSPATINCYIKAGPAQAELPEHDRLILQQRIRFRCRKRTGNDVGARRAGSITRAWTSSMPVAAPRLSGIANLVAIAAAGNA
ncbi:hypothetical protein Adi01nite_56080 [Amorphoplanes digitatis]|nr:hypothetical protein Adi01nite_56080 [Actinoplanes digitatis]